ncbi:MAG: hypothetical protein JWQ66_3299 [Mucilaginibacter sp.]|nr:hypothetical protein [Mucilaginibacter sp.]
MHKKSDELLIAFFLCIKSRKPYNLLMSPLPAFELDIFFAAPV